MSRYSGTGVAIVTPFTPDNQVDFSALQKIIDHLIEGGISYIVSLGTTGETATLTQEEKRKIVQKTIEVVNDRIPVIVGAGGNNTEKVVQDMKAMTEWGDFDTFLSVSPAYNKPSQEGIYQHYKRIAESTDKDIILYNVPGRTARNMEVETTLRLAKNFNNIIGIKEAGNSINQSQELAFHKPEDFLLISGDDDLLLHQMGCGFDGVISVVANAYPKEWSDLVRLAANEHTKSAGTIFKNLLPFANLIFTENNPAGVKCAMNEMGLCENLFRLPVVSVSKKLDEQIRDFVRNFD